MNTTTSSNPSAAAEFPKSVAAVICGWLVPGIGHVIVGDRKRGFGLFALIGGAFLFGLVLSGGLAVSKKVHPVSFYAQLGCGSGALVANAIAGDEGGDSSISEFREVQRFYDAGLLFCNVAGLLNVLAIVQLIERRFGRREESAA